ncbi:SHOCT domain-containing protein [Leifsonia sp. C5G2]|nr:SHOCT domain-containing protein [Leifsonia sp. C5G2]
MPPRFARHLRKLASLHAEGILTDAEYEQGKRKLLE